MLKLQIIFILLFAMVQFGISGSSVAAQYGRQPLPRETGAGTTSQQGTFGKFEVGLPGIPEGQTIDDFVKNPEPIVQFVNLAVNAVIAVLVIIGLISIVIGGYVYMTAGGDASRVKLAKEMMIAALAGIFLSLVSVIILNTVNRYLGSDAQEPTINKPGSPSNPNALGPTL